MELADRVSESVIKILYNVKESVNNDVAKWTQGLDDASAIQEQDITPIYFQPSSDAIKKKDAQPLLHRSKVNDMNRKQLI